MKKIGKATALEVRATGIQYVFAPCIAVSTMHEHNARPMSYNVILESTTAESVLQLKQILFAGLLELCQVCRDPRWGRCYESFSEDYQIVREMTEIIPGLQGDLPANYSKGAPYVAGK